MDDPAAPTTPLEYRAIWAIALPAMVTNVATAMIGVGDMWIVGRLGDAPTQGAVDIGARLFAMLFVVMNFLKTGTTGLVAQAGTRQGTQEQAAVLMRGLAVGQKAGGAPGWGCRRRWCPRCPPRSLLGAAGRGSSWKRPLHKSGTAVRVTVPFACARRACDGTYPGTATTPRATGPGGMTE